MGNQPSINASCMFEQNWRFFGVRGCPEDPLRAPLDARRNLSCTDTIPADYAGYCACGRGVRVVRCHDVPSTCESLCMNEQRTAITDEVARHREESAPSADGTEEGEEPLAADAWQNFGLVVLGILVLYALTSSSRAERTTADKVGDFLERERRLDRTS